MTTQAYMNSTSRRHRRSHIRNANGPRSRPEWGGRRPRNKRNCLIATWYNKENGARTHPLSDKILTYSPLKIIALFSAHQTSRILRILPLIYRQIWFRRRVHLTFSGVTL